MGHLQKYTNNTLSSSLFDFFSVFYFYFKLESTVQSPESRVQSSFYTMPNRRGSQLNITCRVCFVHVTLGDCYFWIMCQSIRPSTLTEKYVYVMMGSNDGYTSGWGTMTGQRRTRFRKYPNPVSGVEEVS